MTTPTRSTYHEAQTTTNHRRAREYVELFDVHSVVKRHRVTEYDVRRVLYEIGRAERQAELEARARELSSEPRYETGEYLVFGDVEHYDYVQDVTADAVTENECLWGDSAANGIPFHEHDDDVNRTARIYRERLVRTVFDLMRTADRNDTTYDASYPLVALKA